MTPHIPEEFSTRLIDWTPFVITANTMPPRVLHPNSGHSSASSVGGWIMRASPAHATKL